MRRRIDPIENAICAANADAMACPFPSHGSFHMLATKYATEPIGDPFGFPLRLRTATKLGFKNAKWVTAIEVTNDFPDTYYRKEGFNWFAGI
jgi:DMSO/TMAO reductase YedYZ molybdopterin-dependent catalytic subunit